MRTLQNFFDNGKEFRWRDVAVPHINPICKSGILHISSRMFSAESDPGIIPGLFHIRLIEHILPVFQQEHLPVMNVIFLPTNPQNAFPGKHHMQMIPFSGIMGIEIARQAALDTAGFHVKRTVLVAQVFDAMIIGAFEDRRRFKPLSVSHLPPSVAGSLCV